MTLDYSSLIEEIDKKIIELLFEDSRLNFSEIGKKIGLSKNAVWTRYKNMCKHGIIKGSTININYKRLGYDAVGQILLYVDPPRVEQVVNYIKEKIPDVFGPTIITSSRYNVRAIVTLKKIGALGDLKEDLRRRLPIIEIQSVVWTDVWFAPQNLTLLNIEPDKRSKSNSNDKQFSADSKDLAIIKQLSLNSRLSFRSIGEKLGFSTDTIARRYQKLRDEYIIVPRIQIDPKKIGYSCSLHYFLRIDQNRDTNSIVEKFLSIPDLFYLMKCTGDYQISAIFAVRDLDQVMEIGKYISKIEGIRLIESVINPIVSTFPISRTYTST